jgi:hypothetical protein
MRFKKSQGGSSIRLKKLYGRSLRDTSKKMEHIVGHAIGKKWKIG